MNITLKRRMARFLAVIAIDYTFGLLAALVFFGIQGMAWSMKALGLLSVFLSLPPVVFLMLCLPDRPGSKTSLAGDTYMNRVFAALLFSAFMVWATHQGDPREEVWVLLYQFLGAAILWLVLGTAINIVRNLRQTMRFYEWLFACSLASSA
jgi:hypothetical protein